MSICVGHQGDGARRHRRHRLGLLRRVPKRSDGHRRARPRPGDEPRACEPLPCSGSGSSVPGSLRGWSPARRSSAPAPPSEPLRRRPGRSPSAALPSAGGARARRRRRARRGPRRNRDGRRRLDRLPPRPGNRPAKRPSARARRIAERAALQAAAARDARRVGGIAAAASAAKRAALFAGATSAGGSDYGAAEAASGHARLGAAAALRAGRAPSPACRAAGDPRRRPRRRGRQSRHQGKGGVSHEIQARGAALRANARTRDALPAGGPALGRADRLGPGPGAQLAADGARRR